MEPPPSDAAAPNSAAREVKPDCFPLDMRVALRDREDHALALFYDCFFDRVYGYVFRMVGRQHLAEDLTQDILMHIIQNLGSYDPNRSPRPWVFKIATNKVLDFWRSSRHRPNRGDVSLDASGAGNWAVATTPRPDELLAAEEQTHQIATAIEGLPDSMRLTLVLRYYEGLSFEAIGEIVDRNETAVRKRYSRALEQLRQALAVAPAGSKGARSPEDLLDGRRRGEER